MSKVDVVRVKPTEKSVVMGGFDVDYVALEFNSQTGVLTDFRLELGRGYMIYWVFPAGPGERLRLFLVDIVAVEIDPSIELEHCFFDYGPVEWSGDLGQVGPEGAYTVESLRMEIGEDPDHYCCTVGVRQPDGTLKTHEIRNQ